MDTCRKFETPTDIFRQCEFYDFRTDNYLRVESTSGSVVVRLMGDGLSPRERDVFIRKLALEGFIPDRYQWFHGSGQAIHQEINWIIDASWIRFEHKLKRFCVRYCRPFVATTIVLALMVLLPCAGVRLIERQNSTAWSRLLTRSMPEITSDQLKPHEEKH